MKLPKAIWRRENSLSGARWGKIPNWPEPSWAAGSERRKGWEVSLVISLIGDWSSLSQVLREPGWVLHQCLAQRATQEVFDLLKRIKEDLYLALEEEQYLSEGRSSSRNSRGIRIRGCSCGFMCRVVGCDKTGDMALDAHGRWSGDVYGLGQLRERSASLGESCAAESQVRPTS